MCGRSWLPVADPAARLSEIIRPALACLVGTRDVQIRSGDPPRSDQSARRPDRRLCARAVVRGRSRCAISAGVGKVICDGDGELGGMAVMAG